MNDKTKKTAIGSEGMSDEEMIEQHAELNNKKHPPTKGFLFAPLIFVFMFGCLIFVCSIQLAHSTNKFALHPIRDEPKLSAEQKEVIRLERKIESGQKIFTMRCASCHQGNGLGIAGQFPPLAGSKWVTSDPGLISKIIINGLKGEIQVKGETYGSNPAQNMVAVPIDDSEIAKVVTYVRQAWGNEASEVSKDEVSGFRAESSNQEGQWTGKQLRDLYSSAFAE